METVQTNDTTTFDLGRLVEVVEASSLVRVGEQGIVMARKPNQTGFGYDLSIRFGGHFTPICLNEQAWANMLKVVGHAKVL
jgi:hypothetical protein